MAKGATGERINTEELILKALELPLVKIDREEFLRKELTPFYCEDIVSLAIESNPARAGIQKSAINRMAEQSINYETKKVTAISAAAGLPGGFAMIGTVPADIAQYFGHILRVMQKLAYLYGFPSLEMRESSINDGTMNEIVIFLGVMFGVQGATSALAKVAELAAARVSKSLAQKALTKTMIYPIVKKIAKSIGVRMTKDIFAKNVSKIIPIIGGLATGTLTYFSFKPCANRLRRSFAELNICDPENFSNSADSEIYEAEVVDAASINVESGEDKA